jgi:hypothetical protein
MHIANKKVVGMLCVFVLLQPAGLKVYLLLAAAIVSSLASMLNSTSTILQWISKQYINKKS